ncbi:MULTISPECIES: hypothetical protein [unclassified Bradyrhizobium]|uniref:hypothetical protein n=1 Tax=Bradyrhizobium TaxID=374 RepID=UPI002916F256|nr:MULTISPECIES: hypothetical protein [unclassified Bradyrhizobium]
MTKERNILDPHLKIQLKIAAHRRNNQAANSRDQRRNFSLRSSAANRFLSDAAMASSFDENSQTFLSGGKPVQTSVYRMFPGSKSVVTGTDEDGDVADLNKSMTSLFVQNAPNDPRRNYRLVGAIWMDKPKLLTANMPIANPAGMDTDDPAAIVAGEDGLSSMAMESFTQNSFVNCFSCHDT